MNEIRKAIDLIHKINYILDKEYKVKGIFILIITFIGSLFELLGVSIMLPFIQVMTNQSNDKSDLFIRIIERIANKFNLSLMIAGAVVVVIVYIVKNLFLTIVSFVRAVYSADVQRSLAYKMTDSYLYRGYEFFNKSNTPQLLQGTTKGVDAVFIVIYHILKILAEMATILCILAYLAFIDISIILCVSVLISVIMTLTMTAFKKMVQDAGNKAHDNTLLSNKWQMQLYEGIKEILATQKQDYFVKNYKETYEARQQATVIQTFASEVPAYIIEAICVVGLIISIGIRMLTIGDAVSYLPTLAMLAMAAFRIMPSAGRITSYYNSALYQVSYVDDIYENVREANGLSTDNSQALKPIYMSSGDKTASFKNVLVINDLLYRYPDTENSVLKGVSMKIRKGESVGLVGPSGAGKSTLADIILGLLRPQKGTIYMDDIDVFENKALWAKIVGFVPQNIFLIDDTVRRNVAFGVSDDQIDDELVITALKKANIYDYINSLPNGLDTSVGERGVRFSGGQAQRLAIARALYRDPDILILDEATSSLDNDTEAVVMRAIDELQGDKTLLVIAHRISTVKNCTKIYEVSDGRVRETSYAEISQK